MDKYLLLKTYIEKLIARYDSNQDTFTDDQKQMAHYIFDSLTLILSTIESCSKAEKSNDSALVKTVQKQMDNAKNK